MLRLVSEEKYFSLHAAQQTGKTTCARWLVDHLNQGDQLHAIWVDVETAREEPEPAIALKTVLGELDLAVQRALPELGLPADRDRLMEDPSTAVLRYLMDLSRRCPRPLVVMMDEADGLVGPAMVCS